MQTDPQEKRLPDGRIADIMPMLFGKWRLYVGTAWTIDDAW